jgi:hypothetical protein
MPVKPHPTDPDKMVYVKAEYNLPKPWVGLTEGDRREIFDATERDDRGYVAALVEAKLKEKNNA